MVERGTSAALKRAADYVARAEADGEGEGQDDSAEEDAEGEFDDCAADLQVVENHGGGENENEPLDSEREETGVLELRVDGADEDGALEKAGDDGAGDEEKDGSDGVGEVGDDDIEYLRVAGVGGVERGDTDEAAKEEASPEDDAGDERCGAVRGRPVGDGTEGVVGEPFVKFCCGEGSAEKSGEARSDGSEDDDGEKKSEEAGEEAREFDEHSVSGLA